VETICGIHAVEEALRAGRPLERVLIQKDSRNPRLAEIVELCRKHGVPVRREERAVLDHLAPATRHQGVVAVGAAARYATLEDLLPQSELLVFLDEVEDPRNLGAILRTAAAMGAGAVVIPERRAAGLTETVAKAAAGALAHVPVARVVNLGRALEQCKEAGFWVYGFDERAEHELDRIQFEPRVAMVFGGEARGLRESTKARCDFLVRIPCPGKIVSLNVSVAAGMALYEWWRARRSRREGVSSD